MHDLSRFCCQHCDCPDHGRRGGENLSVRGRYGKDNRFRLPYCRTCKARFSERKGTPLFNCMLPDEHARAVLAHGAEGGGVRSTSRLVGVHRDKVTGLSGEHAQDQRLTDRLARVTKLPADRTRAQHVDQMLTSNQFVMVHTQHAFQASRSGQ